MEAAFWRNRAYRLLTNLLSDLVIFVMHSPSREVHKASLTTVLKGDMSQTACSTKHAKAAAFSHVEGGNKCSGTGLAQACTAKHLSWHLVHFTTDGARKIIAASLKVR